MEMSQKEKTPRKAVFNVWTLILVIAVIGAIGVSEAKHYGVFDKSVTAYCIFERDVTRDYLPRHECAHLKIVTKDFDQVNFLNFANATFSTYCSFTESKLKSCSGESYHFAQYPMNSLCTKYPCKMRGVVCGAYYLTYFGNTTEELRDDYEDTFFTTPDVQSEQELIKLLNECDD